VKIISTLARATLSLELPGDGTGYGHFRRGTQLRLDLWRVAALCASPDLVQRGPGVDSRSALGRLPHPAGFRGRLRRAPAPQEAICRRHDRGGAYTISGAGDCHSAARPCPSRAVALAVFHTPRHRHHRWWDGHVGLDGPPGADDAARLARA